MAEGAKPAERVWPVLGTMTFGVEGQVKPLEAGVIVRAFVGAGCAQAPGGAMIDTARAYQLATPDGDTETTLGQIFAESPSLADRVQVATKANVMIAPHYSLSRQSVIEQCNTCLGKLGISCIALFYLHSPDVKTDMEDTLDGIAALHAEGKIREFGLSNYPAWAVVDIWYRCKRRGMVLPTAYQGMYNVITRGMEPEIVPVARHFGLRLYMYNPLAGGLLSGRYTQAEDLASAAEGRFSAQFDNAFGAGHKAGTVLYRARYSKQPIFDALGILRAALEAASGSGGPPAAAAPSEPALVQESTSVVGGVHVKVRIEESVGARAPVAKGLDMPSVALRWLIHHSLLAPGDGIILGVSKQQHLVANLAAWQGGPLPAELVAACDAAWEAARPACEPYFRGLGAKPGGIELFLQVHAESQKKRALQAQQEDPQDGEAKRAKAS